METVGKHAFYGMDRVTLFCEAESIPPYWHERWNTSYRALLWGCELSDEGYVVSFTKTVGSTDHLTAPDATLAPDREGYVLAGWSQAPDSTEIAYAPQDIASCPDGTVLYAVWTEYVPEPDTEAETTTETVAEPQENTSAETTN